jgi:hypothetical protein
MDFEGSVLASPKPNNAPQPTTMVEAVVQLLQDNQRPDPPLEELPVKDQPSRIFSKMFAYAAGNAGRPHRCSA